MILKLRCLLHVDSRLGVPTSQLASVPGQTPTNAGVLCFHARGSLGQGPRELSSSPSCPWGHGNLVGDRHLRLPAPTAKPALSRPGAAGKTASSQASRLEAKPHPQGGQLMRVWPLLWLCPQGPGRSPLGKLADACLPLGTPPEPTGSPSLPVKGTCPYRVPRTPYIINSAELVKL